MFQSYMPSQPAIRGMLLVEPLTLVDSRYRIIFFLLPSSFVALSLLLDLSTCVVACALCFFYDQQVLFLQPFFHWLCVAKNTPQLLQLISGKGAAPLRQHRLTSYGTLLFYLLLVHSTARGAYLGSCVLFSGGFVHCNSRL
uniref:Uncharacterized protein n=2 Tax=Trypanosoma brucei TaxID=5691 RepID=B3GVD1_TRYBB|nr:hypothetical protein [Trypanosoma brucei]CAQ57284.1 hypothetical protein Tb427.BES40.12 [Trypanosoma brucei brucei]